MTPVYIPTTKVKHGTVIRDERGNLHAVNQVIKAVSNGYLVAICQDGHQQALGHKMGKTATY